jgi:hypothetical protein
MQRLVNLALATALLFSMVFPADGQHRDNLVPGVVMQAFTAQYPEVHLRKWTNSPGQASYQALFKLHGSKYAATYSRDGTWESTECSVKWTWDLPGPVQRAWSNTKYKTWLIFEIKKREAPLDTLYSLHVGQIQSLGPDDADIGSEYILYFNQQGALVKEEKQY